MKSLIFKELLLLSLQQKQARRIRFHQSTTIISGDNSTGKSQILKALYACLGAIPAVGSDLVDRAAIKLLLRFSIGGREYRILHDGDAYTLFNESDAVIGSYRNVVGGLAVELARIFDFHLQFYTTANEPRVAHPRYLFAPFYIDQDRGWTSPWASFAKQRSSRRADTLEYHVGIRPNSYYQAKARLRELQNESKEPKFQRDTFAKMIDKIEKGHAQINFTLDLQAYSDDVAQLLIECRKMQQEEEHFRERIVALENERGQLHLEMEIAARAALEFQRDFAHAAKLKDRIECPTCGALYSNGIADRFRIVQDEIVCEDLHAVLATRVAAINAELQNEQARYEEVRTGIEKVNAILSSKQRDLSLHDVIQAEGKREFRDSIVSEIDALDRRLRDLGRKESESRRTMKAASDRKLKDQILDFYRARLQNVAERLQASPVPPEMLVGVAPKIPSGSSEYTRRLLAYFIAVLHTIRRSSSSTYCPVVIDAINQQDQSPENLVRMYEQLAGGLPLGTQLILGCVDTHGVRFPGEIVRLDVKHGLLRREDYKENIALVQSLMDARFAFEQGSFAEDDENA